MLIKICFASSEDIVSWLMSLFNEKYLNIMEQYGDIQYIDSEKYYDSSCEMNKQMIKDVQ